MCFVSFFSICECTEAEAEIILQLKSELREKELKLTDIRLEALSSAHHLDQIREAMNRMQVSAEAPSRNNWRDLKCCLFPSLSYYKNTSHPNPFFGNVLCLFSLGKLLLNTEWRNPGSEMGVQTGQLQAKTIQVTCTCDWVDLRAKVLETTIILASSLFHDLLLCWLFSVLLKSDFQTHLPIFNWKTIIMRKLQKYNSNFLNMKIKVM